MIQVRIPDDAVYDNAGLQKLLGLTSTALRHARNKCGLKFGKRFKRCFYRGSDVKEWLFAANELVNGHTAE